VRGKRIGERPGIEASTREWKEVSSHLSLLTSHPLNKESESGNHHEVKKAPA